MSEKSNFIAVAMVKVQFVGVDAHIDPGFFDKNIKLTTLPCSGKASKSIKRQNRLYQNTIQSVAFYSSLLLLSNEPFPISNQNSTPPSALLTPHCSE